MKKIISWLLVVAMLMAMVPAVFASETATYTKITSADELTTGKYVMTVGDNIALNVVDGTWVTAATPTVDGDTVTDAAGAVWTVTVTETGVSLMDSNGVYIAPKGGNSNGLKTGTEYSWTVTCTDGLFTFGGQDTDTVVLAYNSDSQYMKFRGYKTSTASNAEVYPSQFTLYKLEGEDVETEPDEDEPAYVAPETGATLTVAEAIEAAQNGATGTYYITGVVTELRSTTYGNMVIQDETGSILIYGMYDADGNRYDAMTSKPVVGDTVTVYSTLTMYNTTPEAINATLIELIPAETPYEAPAEGSTLTVAEANEVAMHSPEYKYYITGTVTEIKNTTYGNLYIQDANGDSLYVYGLYDADGTNRFDAMTTQPAVGDIITIYTVLTTYNSTPQAKNAWMTDLIPVGTEANPYIITELPYTATGTFAEANYNADWESYDVYYQYTATEEVSVDLLSPWTGCGVITYVNGEWGELPSTLAAGDVVLFDVWGDLGVEYSVTFTTVTEEENPEEGGDVEGGEVSEGVGSTADNPYIYETVEELVAAWTNWELTGGQTVYVQAPVGALTLNFSSDIGSLALVSTRGNAMAYEGKAYTFDPDWYAEGEAVIFGIWNQATDVPAVATLTVGAEEGGDDTEVTTTPLEIGNNAINAADVTYTFTAASEGVLTLTTGAAVMGEVTFSYSVNGGEATDLPLSSSVELTLVEGDVVTIVVTAAGYSSLTVDWTGETGGDVVTPAGTLVLGDNVDVTLGDYTWTATEDGTLTVTVTALSVYDAETDTWNEVNPSMFGWYFTFTVNGVNNGTLDGTADVVTGDVVTVSFTSDWYEAKATINLAIGETVVEDPNADREGTGAMDDPYIIDSLATPEKLEVIADSYFKYVAEKAGTITLTNIDLDSGLLWQLNGGDWQNASTVTVAEGDVLILNPYYSGSALVYFNELTLGDNYIYIDGALGSSQYVFTATETGTLYIVATYVAYDSHSEWSEGMMDDSEYIADDFSGNDMTYTRLYIDGVGLVNYYYGSVEVVAGQTYTFDWINENEWAPEWSWEATLNLSYSDELIPVPGTESMPISVEIADCPVTTIEVAPGATVYYELVDFYGATLVLNGDDVTVSYSGYDYTIWDFVTYTYTAENGVLEAPISGGYTVIQITNTGDTAATYVIDYYYPLGIYENPDVIVEGENTAEAPEWDSYYYENIFEEDTELTITMLSDNWYVSYTIWSADGDWMGGYDYSSYVEEGMELVNEFTITLTAGQVLNFSVSTPDGSAATITFNADFGGEDEPAYSYTDVAEGAYYYDAVMWASEMGITYGVGDGTAFGVGMGCTRAQVVAFLWRAAGCPEPTSTECSYSDVVAGSYYEKAVIWAEENGIVAGYTDGTFRPGVTCTREQIVAFLWRYAHEPECETANTFPDVAEGKYYTTAVAWATEQGIVSGYNDGTFGVGDTCTREQIVTFLYRMMGQN